MHSKYQTSAVAQWILTMIVIGGRQVLWFIRRTGVIGTDEAVGSRGREAQGATGAGGHRHLGNVRPEIQYESVQASAEADRR